MTVMIAILQKIASCADWSADALGLEQNEDLQEQGKLCEHDSFLFTESLAMSPFLYFYLK